MLLKLYKRDGDAMLYWEAWEENEEIIVHFGVLGDQGETTNIPLAEFEPPDTAIKRHAAEAREAGFDEIEEEDQIELIVQCPVTPTRGEDFPEKIEDALNDALGWTGLGHCESADTADGLINFFCFVIDAKVAVEPIVNALKEAQLLEDAVIAYQNEDEDFVVLHPTDGEFRI